MKKVIDKHEFREAVRPLEELYGKDFSNRQLLDIYYLLFDSPTDKDYIFIINKYCQYYGYTPIDLEVKLIVDLFKKYGLTHRDLEDAFKIRIQKVLAKARIFPTPAELIVLIKPEAIVNIYDDEGRMKALDHRSTEEIQADDTHNKFARIFGKMNG